MGADTLASMILKSPRRTRRLRTWPLVGPALFELWQRAHEDLVSAAQMIQPQLISGGRVLIGAVGNTLLALAFFSSHC